MGQQQSKWQLMQHNLDRDSMSTIQDSPVKEARQPSTAANTLSRESSTRSSIADRRASRRARMLSGTTSRSKDQDGSLSSSSQTSDNTRASMWQVRLAEAHVEYMENAPELISKRKNLNFLSVSKAGLGSPTPPDTDESGSDNEIAYQSLTSKVFNPAPTPKVNKLWEPRPVTSNTSSGLLWTAQKAKPEIQESVQLPGLSVRPAARKTARALDIESTRLWQQPGEQTPRKSSRGLWSKAAPTKRQEQNVSVRPVTQRPPRRSKRVTLLPDICKLETLKTTPRYRD